MMMTLGHGMAKWGRRGMLMWLLLAPWWGWGQSEVLSAGETGWSAVGEVSYSVGQAVVASCEWDVVRVNGGVQQVYCMPTEASVAVQASYFYNWNGRRLAASGIYYDTLLNRMGCDSLLTLDLTVIAAPLPRIVTYDRRVVMVHHYPEDGDGGFVEYGRYRWYRDGVLVADGSQDKYYLPEYPMLDGVFRVEVPADDEGERWVCSNDLDMSRLESADLGGEGLNVEVAPNPVTAGKKMSVRLGPDGGLATMSLYDQSGRVVLRRTIRAGRSVIEMPFAAGVYSLQVTAEDGRKGVKRIVVE